jgi:hypothetical protein
MCIPGFLDPPGKNFSAKKTKFPSMNHDALNEALGGSIGTARNPWGFLKTASILFLDATVQLSTSGLFSSRSVYI